MINEQTARTKFITPGTLTRGTITEVNINEDPFHCIIRIQPSDPALIVAEGRYSDHEISLGKLKRNLVHLKFNIREVMDIIAAVESLEGRECIFRVDKSGWISWIAHVEPVEPVKPKPDEDKEIPRVEIYFVREPGHRCIYKMTTTKGEVQGWAVGPTGQKTPNAHGWILNLTTMEEAIEVLTTRKDLDK